MKIEMGESLGISWIKHIQKCSVVQNSWKAPAQGEWHRLSEIERLKEEVASELGDAAEDVFGRKSVRQALSQTECDVIGFRYSAEGSASIISLEIAIHLAGCGLHYSGTKHDRPTVKTNVSEDKVVAKLFFASMAIYSVFGLKNGEYVFATPIASEEICRSVSGRLMIAENVLKRHGLDVRFKFLANADFRDQILRPVVEMKDTVADTSELFLRAMQLYFASEQCVCNTDEVENGGRNRVSYDVCSNRGLIGENLTMGQSAYVVVREHAESNHLSYEQLRVCFPRTVNGMCEVFVGEDENYDVRRYSEDSFVLIDGTRVHVSNQWCARGTHENWSRFCDCAMQFGMRIVQH